uniref:Centromere protein I n=2 Tax=Arcella intermedia TaxID=1963864 RepID=A0A6B2L040_9EUKA
MKDFEFNKVVTYAIENPTSNLWKAFLPVSGRIENIIISSLLNRLLSFPSKISQWILKWIAMVYDYISDKLLQKFYCYFFQLLEYEEFRKSILIILYRLTNRDQMKRYRINRLLNLHQKSPKDADIQALLKLYHTYHPHISIPIITTTSEPFPCPDASWYKTFCTIQSLSTFTLKKRSKNRATFSHQNTISSHWLPKNTYKVNINNLVPPLETYILVQDRYRKIWYEQITSFNEWMKNLTQLKQPSQMASAFGNKYYAYNLLFDNNIVTQKQLDYWVEKTIQKRFFFHPVKNVEENSDFLQILGHYYNFSKEMDSTFTSFLLNFCTTWDGISYQKYIFRLIGLIRPIEPEYLKFLYQALWKIFSSASIPQQYDFIHCLLEMLQTWMQIDYHCEYQQERFGWDAKEIEKKYFTSISLLSEMIAHSLTVYSISNPRNPFILDCIIDYLNILASCSEFNLYLLLIPPSYLIYLIYFSNKPHFLSILLKTIVKLWINYNHIKRALEDANEISKVDTKMFEVVIVDVCVGIFSDRNAELTVNTYLLRKFEKYKRIFQLYDHPAFTIFQREWIDQYNTLHNTSHQTIDFMENIDSSELVTFLKGQGFSGPFAVFQKFANKT